MSVLAAKTRSTSALLAASTFGALPLAFSSLVNLNACNNYTFENSRTYKNGRTCKEWSSDRGVTLVLAAGQRFQGCMKTLGNIFSDLPLGADFDEGKHLMGGLNFNE